MSVDGMTTQVVTIFSSLKLFLWQQTTQVIFSLHGIIRQLLSVKDQINTCDHFFQYIWFRVNHPSPWMDLKHRPLKKRPIWFALKLYLWHQTTLLIKQLSHSSQVYISIKNQINTLTNGNMPMFGNSFLLIILFNFNHHCLWM